MSWRDWKVVRILAGVALKLWAASFGALLVCLLLWCFYGGIFAFVLLLVAISGEFSCCTQFDR
jgi:abhydrolase domain-containing protein 13